MTQSSIISKAIRDITNCRNRFMLSGNPEDLERILTSMWAEAWNQGYDSGCQSPKCQAVVDYNRGYTDACRNIRDFAQEEMG